MKRIVPEMMRHLDSQACSKLSLEALSKHESNIRCILCHANYLHPLIVELNKLECEWGVDKNPTGGMEEGLISDYQYSTGDSETFEASDRSDDATNISN